MDVQIHKLEQEAYTSVLRAFKAQSDAITWEKESLITELRKELRVSDDEHRDLLSRVNRDEIILKIRAWRENGGNQSSRFDMLSPVTDIVPASRKRMKASQATNGSNVHGIHVNRGSGDMMANNPAHSQSCNKLIGRKVWTRWPEDNTFYEAVVADYNPNTDQFALCYERNTENEAWEWVDLKEIAQEDIRWDGPDPGMPLPTIQGGHEHVSGAGKSQLHMNHGKDFLSTHNGLTRQVIEDIELLNTESLVQEVEKIFNVARPDPLELAKAKMMLKEHEQTLMAAIAKLNEVSEGESDVEQFSHDHAIAV